MRRAGQRQIVAWMASRRPGNPYKMALLGRLPRALAAAMAAMPAVCGVAGADHGGRARRGSGCVL